MADRKHTIRCLQMLASNLRKYSEMRMDCHSTLPLIEDAISLLKEDEKNHAVPYGQMMFFDLDKYRTFRMRDLYQRIVEHMLDLGILKIEKEERPDKIIYTWFIKAVKQK